MKKIGIILSALTLILVVGFNKSYAQKKKNEVVYEAPALPIEESSNKINYTEVVSTPGTPNELYKKALRWFNTYYKNPTDVIREKNEEEGSIIGKARFKYMTPPNKDGQQSMQGILQYTIYFYAKDGRYKYEIKEWNLKATSYTPAENWMDKNSQTYTNSYDYYLIQLDNYAKETVKSLNDFMTNQVEKKSEEW